MPISESLIAAARQLAIAADGAGVDVPLLIGLRPYETGGRVADVRCLGGPPERLLLGWHAPRAWSGCVLVGRRPDTGGAVALGIDERRVPVVVGPGLQPRVPAPGPISDTLHRALRLATPIAPFGVRSLAAAVWLHRLVELALDHPRPGLLLPADLARRAPVGLAAHIGSWRQLAQELRDQPCRIAPALVDWFDSGSYARWLIGQLPDPADMWADLTELLASPTSAWLEKCLGNESLATTDLWAHAGCDPDPLLASFEWTYCDIGAP